MQGYVLFHYNASGIVKKLGLLKFELGGTEHYFPYDDSTNTAKLLIHAFKVGKHEAIIELPKTNIFTRDLTADTLEKTSEKL